MFLLFLVTHRPAWRPTSANNYVSEWLSNVDKAAAANLSKASSVRKKRATAGSVTESKTPTASSKRALEGSITESKTPSTRSQKIPAASATRYITSSAGNKAPARPVSSHSAPIPSLEQKPVPKISKVTEKRLATKRADNSKPGFLPSQVALASKSENRPIRTRGSSKTKASSASSKNIQPISCEPGEIPLSVRSGGIRFRTTATSDSGRVPTKPASKSKPASTSTATSRPPSASQKQAPSRSKPALAFATDSRAPVSIKSQSPVKPASKSKHAPVSSTTSREPAVSNAKAPTKIEGQHQPTCCSSTVSESRRFTG